LTNYPNATFFRSLSVIPQIHVSERNLLFEVTFAVYHLRGMKTMLPDLFPLRETHMVGPTCKEWVMGRDRFPQFFTHNFAWVGHSALLPPYRMVRMKSFMTHIVACHGGRGRVVIDGRAQLWEPGRVLLCPRGACHAFEAFDPDTPWLIAWVFCDEKSGPRVVEGDRARMIDADVSGFVSVLQLMAKECAAEADPAAIQSLISLLDIHSRRLGGGGRIDARLAALWERVDADLGRDWDVPGMARTAGMGDEQLRRLCLRDFGTSPMRRLTQLRMHRACVLLGESDCKVQALASMLGYESAYAFSTSFKKWSGLSPSAFRQRERGPVGGEINT
jgi:AraC-like DNA-binding protein